MAKKGQNLVNAIDAVNGLPAIDFNSATREVQDAFIECQPSIPDPSGTAQYGANNEIKQYLDLQTISRASAFICSGSGNAYVLTTDTAVHLRQFTFIQKYSKIHFIASFTNTGACTVNVDFFGIKSIKLADGSDPLAGYITANNRYTIYYNGTNWVLTNPTISTTYIQQPIILSNNITNPNTQIDFAAGNFAFSDGSSFANFSAITKRLNANWVVGTNQGGLFTGTVQANSTYHCIAIYNPTTKISDVGFLLGIAGVAPDPTSVLPSGFTKWKRIGSIMTNVSGNIRQAKWNIEGLGVIECIYSDVITDFNQGTNLPTTKTLQPLTLPVGISVKAIMQVDTPGLASGFQQWFCFEPNFGLNSFAYIDLEDPIRGILGVRSVCRTNRNAQIQHYFLSASNGTAGNSKIGTMGYYDYIL